jgi:hypothetical protein
MREASKRPPEAVIVLSILCNKLPLYSPIVFKGLCQLGSLEKSKRDAERTHQTE